MTSYERDDVKRKIEIEFSMIRREQTDLIDFENLSPQLAHDLRYELATGRAAKRQLDKFRAARHEFNLAQQEFFK